MKSRLQVLAGLLLCALSSLAMAQERMDDVLRDFQAHGYPSVSAAIQRLSSVEDVPGANASMARRETYHRSLLQLARAGRQPAIQQSSRAVLQRMADDEQCVRCRFDLAIAAVLEQGGRGRTRRAALARLKEAKALRQQLDSPEAEQALLEAEAVLAQWNGEYNRAIELFVRASEQARQRGDVAGQLLNLAGMIGLNADLGDTRRAIDVGNEAYRRAEEIGYTALLAQICLDLGHAYSLVGDRAHQRAILEKGLALTGNDPDQLPNKTTILNNLSDFWLSQPGGYPKTLDYAQRALQLARESGQQGAEIAPMANIGIARAGMGQVDQGVAILRESIDLSKKSGIDVYTLGITEELVRILKQAGRHQEALEALQSIIQLQEKHIREERETAVLELQEKYATQRKADEIEKLAAQNRLKQSQLEAEGLKQRLWLALAGVFGLGLLMLWQSIQRARNTNRKLADVNATLALQSSTDALTGAFNRRYAQALLDKLQAQMQRSGSPQGFGLILLDLDLFKRINDTRGHAAGDAVLVETVKRLQSRLRQNDVVSRWGGEEFVLVLPSTPASSLPIVARNVLEAIGNEPFLFEGQSIPVSVSLGVIGYPLLPGQAWASALGLADSALYLAKASGRNQAICIRRMDVEPSCSEADLTQLQAAGKAEWQVVTGPELAPGTMAPDRAPPSGQA